MYPLEYVIFGLPVVYLPSAVVQLISNHPPPHDAGSAKLGPRPIAFISIEPYITSASGNEYARVIYLLRKLKYIDG